MRWTVPAVERVIELLEENMRGVIITGFDAVSAILAEPVWSVFVDYGVEGGVVWCPC